MLSKIKNRKQEGFTIIEVMIVLAIAALILLIVFLAVPALQRNAHNTSAKNDVAGVLAAVSEYSTNNNGKLPPVQGAGTVGATTVYVGGTAAACTVANNTLNCSTAKVGFYTADKLTVVAAIPAAFPAQGSVVIVEGALCNGNTPSTVGASSRGFIAEYTLEGGSQQCTAS